MLDHVKNIKKVFLKGPIKRNEVPEIPLSFTEAHLDFREHIGDGIFLFKNLDLGLMYSISGLYDETLTPSELEYKILNFFKGIRILTSIPSRENHKNITYQIICSQRGLESAPKKEKEYSNRQEGEILSMDETDLFSHIQFIKRNFYITVRFSPIKKKTKNKFSFEELKNDLNFIKKIESFRNDLDSDKEEFLKSISLFENQFDADMNLRRLNLEEVYTYFEDRIFGGEKATNALSEYNIHQSFTSPCFEDNTNSLRLNDKKIELYYLDQLPSEYKLGNFKYFMEGIPLPNWDLVLSFSFIDKEYSEKLMILEGWYGRGKNKKIFKEFESFRENVNSLNPHCAQSLRLICYNPKDETAGLLQSNTLNTLGVKIYKEDFILLHMFASSLPLNLRSDFNNMIGRFRNIRLENSMCFLPIYDGPKEVGVRHHCSRIMTPTSYDLFAGSGNKMTTVLGASRAGKSVFIGLSILEFLDRFPDGIIRVVDKKTSYQKTADLLNGRLIRFSEDELRAKKYSPFNLSDWEESDMESLYLLISTCIAQKNPDCAITGIHSEILKESLKLAFNMHLYNLRESDGENINPHPVWADVISQMPTAVINLKANGAKDIETYKEDLVRWSVSLFPTGQYNFLFSEYELKTNINENERFLVYDLDGISDPILQQLSAMMAFLKISRDLKKYPLSSPKLIIFEELGMLLTGDERVQKLNTEFIQNVVKTCAKYQAQAMTITNEVADYSQKAAGQTIWENATQKVFLPLGDLYPSALKAWENTFSVAEWEILKSLRKEPAQKRTSVYVRSFNELRPYKGSFYVPLTPAMDALTTTSGPQLQLYSDLKNRGLNTAEALNYMATNHPYGEKL